MRWGRSLVTTQYHLETANKQRKHYQQYNDDDDDDEAIMEIFKVTTLLLPQNQKIIYAYLLVLNMQTYLISTSDAATL
jgi:hypothetical protein